MSQDCITLAWSLHVACEELSERERESWERGKEGDTTKERCREGTYKREPERKRVPIIQQEREREYLQERTKERDRGYLGTRGIDRKTERQRKREYLQEQERVNQRKKIEERDSLRNLLRQFPKHKMSLSNLK